MVTETYSVVVNKFKNGVPVEYGVKFNNGTNFPCGFESENIANLGAQLFELVNYNISLWFKAFPLTLRMWGIESQWTEI